MDFKKTLSVEITDPKIIIHIDLTNFNASFEHSSFNLKLNLLYEA